MPDTTVVDPSANTTEPPAATDPVLPSERLTRLAELAVAALDQAGPVGAGVPQIPEQAMADVLAAVDASTAANTKAAYRSDWARFTLWADAGGFPPLPASPLVVAHYVTESAAEQIGVGKWRYTPATLTRWVSSINQFHTAAGLDAPGRAEVVRRALSGVRRIREFVDEYTLADGRKLHLLGEGRLVNLAAAEGHPAAVMDMSFADQALAVEWLVKHHAELEPQVYGVPKEIDVDVARLKLEAMGVEIDTLTREQETYLRSWQEGT